MASRPHKTKILLGYMSSEVDDFFLHDVAPAGYTVTSIHFKNSTAFYEGVKNADVIFIQWTGRGQAGHDLISKLSKDSASGKIHASVYAVTLANIRIETLSTKNSRQLNISGWFDVPLEKPQLLAELSLLIPDSYDDFKSDIDKCGVDFMSKLPLESLSGKHLVNQIQAAWDARLERATNVTRVRDEILRSHVLFFHNDEARVNDLKSFLTDVKFKYHDEFSDLVSCMRWIRGHGTDCIVIWYDANSRDSENLLRLYTENRNFRRIPFVVIYPSELALTTFKKRCGDIFVDKFILFDRNREKFRVALMDAFESVPKDTGPRKLLEDLRITSLDFPPVHARALTLADVDAVSAKLATDPAFTYWAIVEKILGYARLKESSYIGKGLLDLDSNYESYDSLMTSMIVKCTLSKQDALSAANMMMQKIPFLKDFDFDRLVRLSITFQRIGAVDSLKTLLVLWWHSGNKFEVEHEFYWAASRWAQLSGFLALERALIALAIKGDPLRYEYVEAYANHLIATGHSKHAIQLSEYLTKSEYFPSKKAWMLLFNAYVKKDDKAGAGSVLAQMIVKWPADKQLIALKAKVGMA